ncbi:hypothetical protein ACH347_26105 [Saccharopolyspora sp. 5N102]|uniref:hypothetical protein n=1 Tax=Saccharopolyspora sp. 5N102 TaxID=3375155 RepID=UPI00379450DF
MSDLGYLVCAPCKMYLTLGKPVLKDDESVNYYHLGPRNNPRNPTQTLLNESLWKFLADHTGHPLVIRFDYEAGMEEVEEDGTEIGGETADDDIPFEQYLLNWDGLNRSNFDSFTLERLRRPAVQVEPFNSNIEPPATAIHVDLPESALKRWRNERHEHPIRAIGVSGTSRSSSLVRNLGLPSPHLLDQIGDIAALTRRARALRTTVDGESAGSDRAAALASPNARQGAESGSRPRPALRPAHPDRVLLRGVEASHPRRGVMRGLPLLQERLSSAVQVFLMVFGCGDR